MMRTFRMLSLTSLLLPMAITTLLVGVAGSAAALPISFDSNNVPFDLSGVGGVTSGTINVSSQDLGGNLHEIGIQIDVSGGSLTGVDAGVLSGSVSPFIFLPLSAGSSGPGVAPDTATVNAIQFTANYTFAGVVGGNSTATLLFTMQLDQGDYFLNVTPRDGAFETTVINFSVVPEPGTALLLGLGLFGLGAARRR